jgi:hypothetical protein
MASQTINSNLVAIYVTPTTQKDPIPTLLSSTSSVTGANSILSMYTNEIAFVLNPAGVIIGIGQATSNEVGPLVDWTGAFGFLGAATSCTLDVNLSVNRQSALVSMDNSQSFVSTGATVWTSNIDALVQIDDVTNEGNLTSLIEMADKKLSVVGLFRVGYKRAYLGQGYIGSVSVSSSVDELATYAMTLEGHGRLYEIDVDASPWGGYF